MALGPRRNRPLAAHSGIPVPLAVQDSTFNSRSAQTEKRSGAGHLLGRGLLAITVVYVAGIVIVGVLLALVSLWAWRAGRREATPL